jgi:hypothetical protein
VGCGRNRGEHNAAEPALSAALLTEDFVPTANSFISEPSAIGSLISDRSRVLGLRPRDLVRRVNYKNIAKGLRRLDELLAGDLDKARDLICALPAALDVPPEVVERAIDETRRQVAEALEAERHVQRAAWRAAFKPHAIILTEKGVPQPIFVAAIIGARRLLRVDFDLALGPGSYANQALAGVQGKLAEFRSESGKIPETLPAFGRPVGVIVNYTPDRAVRFDLDGKPHAIFPRAHRHADAYLALCSRPTRPSTLRTIMPVKQQ